MDQTKKIFDHFDDSVKRLEERNKANENRNGDDTVEVLKRMTAVYKANLDGQSGTDLEERLRLVREAAESMEEGPMAQFAKLFVHMHSNVLEMRPIPSTSSSSLPSYSSSLPSTSSDPSSSSSSNIPEGAKEKSPSPSSIPWVGPLPVPPSTSIPPRSRGRPSKVNRSISLVKSPVKSAVVATSTPSTSTKAESSVTSDRSGRDKSETGINQSPVTPSTPASTKKRFVHHSETASGDRNVDGSGEKKTYAMFTPHNRKKKSTDIPETPRSKKNKSNEHQEIITLDDSTEEGTVADDTVEMESIDTRGEMKEEEEETTEKNMEGLRVHETQDNNGSGRFILRGSTSRVNQSISSPRDIVPGETVKKRKEEAMDDLVDQTSPPPEDPVPSEGKNEDEGTTERSGEDNEVLERSNEEGKENSNNEKKKRRFHKNDLTIAMNDSRVNKDEFLPPREAKYAAAGKLTRNKKHDRNSLVRTTLIRQATATGLSSSSSIDRAKRQAAMLEATFSPRSKKARVAMREAHKSSSDTITVPEHAGRGDRDKWTCGGKTCRRHFNKHSDMFRHMQTEHWGEGPVVGKCLDCGMNELFGKLIEHRKSGSQDQCGGTHSTLAYWCLEEDKGDLTMKKEKESDKELESCLRTCFFIGCEKQGKAFDSFEEVQSHNEKMHSTRLYYICPNKLCNRTFTQPLSFIRHRGNNCEGAIPDIEYKSISKKDELDSPQDDKSHSSPSC